MRLRTLIVTIVIALALAVAGIAAGLASAAGEPRGATIGGFELSLSLGSNGQAVAFKIAPTSLSCKGNKGLTTRKLTIRDLDVTGVDGFSDDLKIRERLDKYRLRSTIHVDGTDYHDGTWYGHYDRTTDVLRKGRKIDTCVITTDWTASQNWMG